ncbi:MAG: 2'-5' RNA ligase family protein [Peptostreptococcaceae bacterium]
MRYVIVSVLKGEAGIFNNKIKKEISKKFNVKSSKLPPHFTIKSPFEASNIDSIDSIIKNFCACNNKSYYKISGYDNFDDRVIYMKVLMGKDSKTIHDKLINSISSLDYIKFNNKDGKDKIFHITIASKKINKIFNNIYEYVNTIPCEFKCTFDNVSIFKLENNTWILHKEYLFK